MNLPDRTFQTVHAEPGAPVPLWVAFFGPSGGGKTMSALKIATGIQAVIGGRINFIDTESGRGRHYARMFDYDYTPFPPPHGALDYAAAIAHAYAKGGRIIIVDSFSHEHEGEGGLIESHEAELTRMAGSDYSKREKMKMLAWAKPKAARKQLLRAMLAYGTEVVFILCFRADESSKPVMKGGKTEVVQLGFMPIAGKPFVYEATVCALLMPAANGVPTWEPENVGEKLMRKLPEQFKKLFEDTKNQPISEAHGRALAEWARGSTSRSDKEPKEPSDLSTDEKAAALKTLLKSSPTIEKLEARWSQPKAQALRIQLSGDVLRDLENTYSARHDELSERRDD